MVSKIGGAFAWPSDEISPVCPTKSCPAVPVIQLRQADFPDINFPDQTDLFQLLWYPQSYEELCFNPKIEIYWRQSTKLSDSSIIEPVYGDYESIFFIHECRIEPEQVIEYPYIGLLSEEEQQAIWKWESAQDDPMARYQYCLSTCPGTKVGGYPEYAGQDVPTVADTNRRKLEYLLTLSDSEWDGGSFPAGDQSSKRFRLDVLLLKICQAAGDDSTFNTRQRKKKSLRLGRANVGRSITMSRLHSVPT